MEWSRQKVDSQNLNNGQEYTVDSQVSIEQLNAMVNGSLYAQDIVDRLKATPYNSATTYQFPNIVAYNGSSYMAIYKENDIFAQFSGITPPNSQYWELLAQKGADGVKGDSGINSALLSNVAGTSDTNGYTQRAVNAIVSNQNLLRNSNFAINQRGKSSYTGAIYGVDGWKSISSNNTVTVLPKGIRFNNNSNANSYIKQILTGDYAGLTLTLSANISSIISGIARLAIYYSTNATTWTLINGINISNNGISSIKATIPNEAVYISADLGSNSNGSIEFLWAKLEVGNVATTYIQPRYNQDLEDCQYYFKQIKTLTGSMYQSIAIGDSINATTFRYIIPNVMYATPTISTNGTFAIVSATGTNPVTNMNIVNMSSIGVVINVNVQNAVPIGEVGLLQANNDNTAYISLDAEI